jgi:hypothetical protein
MSARSPHLRTTIFKHRHSTTALDHQARPLWSGKLGGQPEVIELQDAVAAVTEVIRDRDRSMCVNDHRESRSMFSLLIMLFKHMLGRFLDRLARAYMKERQYGAAVLTKVCAVAL